MRPRHLLGTAAVVLVVAALVVVSARAGWIDWGGDPQPAAAATREDTSWATVEERDVTARIQIKGSLGYAGSFQVINRQTGTLTDVPAAGDVLESGEVAYRVDGEPVVLLDGTVPAWRDLDVGTEGADVAQLNAALVALGYTDNLKLDPKSDSFDWRTREAVRRLQEDLGVSETGAVSLGDVVFLPTPIRVTTVKATLGASVHPGTPIIMGSSTRPVVTAKLASGRARKVDGGDAVTITLPDQSTTTGTVRRVGSVATAQKDGSATVPVLIALDKAKAAAGLDQVPVLVGITTKVSKDALVVPVTALVALAGGGYAVEVAAGADTRLVPVKLGVFDSGGGVVAVTGDLKAGQRVVVPST